MGILANIISQRSQELMEDIEDFVEVLPLALLLGDKLHLFSPRGYHIQECQKGILMLDQILMIIKFLGSPVLASQLLIKECTTILRMRELLLGLGHMMQLLLITAIIWVLECDPPTSHTCKKVLNASFVRKLVRDAVHCSGVSHSHGYVSNAAC